MFRSDERGGLEAILDTMGLMAKGWAVNMRL